VPSIDNLLQEPCLESAEERDDGLRRAVAVQQSLARPALEGRGLDGVAEAISAAVGGGILVLGPTRRLIARHDPTGALTDEVAAELGRELAARGDSRPCLLAHPELPAGAYARPVSSTPGARAQAWIVIATADGRVDESVRLGVKQAEAIVGLELMRGGGIAGETERRLTAGLLGDAIAGRIDGEDLGRRLAAFGIEGEVAVLIFTVAGAAAERGLQEAFVAMELAAAVSTQGIAERELLCAIVEVGERGPIELAGEVRGRLVDVVGGGQAGEILAAVGQARPVAELAHTFQEACWALEAIERKGGGSGADAAGGGEVVVGSWRDLGVESLLLAVADENVLGSYCDRLLGPVLAGESIYAAELLRSLELFILHNGQWERAARELHCHRHTLRYRIRKVEELTGRDLAKATDRIEFWLALRARELFRHAR